jgi:tetratricopeptide (TPR) repeat protein
MPTPDELYREHDQLKAQGDLEAALEKLNQALAIDANFVDGHLALAVLLQKMNRHEEAVRHGERACELAPQEAFNFTALSVTYQRAWQGTGDYMYIQKAEDAKARAHMLEGR